MSGDADIERATRVLRRGGLVAFPTETVYGLGADATDDIAIARLYAVKGRPADHPVIVHIASADALTDWARAVPAVAVDLARAFWPGPLTVVVPAAASVSRLATGGLDTVAVRVPAHPLALELLATFDGALAAPSANRFGRVSPTTADAVARDLGSDVDVVLDGGPCVVGVESTIVDCTGAAPSVLRVGGVTLEALAEILGAVPPVGGVTRAPGTLAAHYAPVARVELVEAAELSGRAQELAGQRVGVLGLAADLDRASVPVTSVSLARPTDDEEFARELFGALRQADDLGLDVVLAIAPPVAGLGVVVIDRLSRAAHGR